MWVWVGLIRGRFRPAWALVAVALTGLFAVAEGADQALGLVEFVAYPATLFWLTLSMSLRPGRFHPSWARVATVVVGCTVAQPFGAVATPITPQQFRAEAGAPVSATGWHRLSVGPFPVAVLKVYGRGVPGYVEDAGDVTEWIRARTWLGPLTNGAECSGREDDNSAP